jgi:hypothetical protein
MRVLLSDFLMQWQWKTFESHEADMRLKSLGIAQETFTCREIAFGAQVSESGGAANPFTFRNCAGSTFSAGRSSRRVDL